LFVIPLVVVILFVAIKLPPVILMIFWVIEPEVVVPEEMFKVPVELEIFSRVLEPERLRVPELEILAAVTFWSELEPEEEISYFTEGSVVVIAPRILEFSRLIEALLLLTVMRVSLPEKSIFWNTREEALSKWNPE